MSASKMKSFSAVLEPDRIGLRSMAARVPFDVARAWPVRKGLRVRGEIFAARREGLSAKSKSEGLAFRSALFSDPQGGGHFLVVNRKMQAAAKATLGSTVRIRLEPDLDERPAVVPAELAQALKGDRRLRTWFDGLNYTTRKAIGDWVKRPRALSAGRSAPRE